MSDKNLSETYQEQKADVEKVLETLDKDNWAYAILCQERNRLKMAIRKLKQQHIKSVEEMQKHWLKDKKGKVIDTNSKFCRHFNLRRSTMKFNRCCKNCKYCKVELITDTNFLPYNAYTCSALPDQSQGNNNIDWDSICNNYIEKGTQK
jgi:hypothetical protein